MALTEIFVDPSLNSDTGSGTIGDPFGDLEYAIEQTTFDTTNGTRVNIKAGTDEVLAAPLQTALADTSVTVAWVPTSSAPLVFQGYTSAVGDGGIGGISGGGSFSIIGDPTIDYVHLVNLHCHNTGSNPVIDIDNWCSVTRCEIENSSSNGISFDTACIAAENYVHNIGGIGILIGGSGSCAAYNHLADGTNTFSQGILSFSGSTVERNIVSLTGNGDGIVTTLMTNVIGNSIFSSGSVGTGIVSNASVTNAIITNNVIEGFSGAGGIGIDLGAAAVNVVSYGGNAVYNCATEYVAASGIIIDDLGDNEILTASPFTNAAGGDFNPVDTGNVKEGALPHLIGGGLV